MRRPLLDPSRLTDEQIRTMPYCPRDSVGAVRQWLEQRATEQDRPKAVQAWLDQELADSATRAEVEQEVERMRREQDEPSDG